jgi:hypothetical protein
MGQPWLRYLSFELVTYWGYGLYCCLDLCSLPYPCLFMLPYPCWVSNNGLAARHFPDEDLSREPFSCRKSVCCLDILIITCCFVTCHKHLQLLMWHEKHFMTLVDCPCQTSWICKAQKQSPASINWSVGLLFFWGKVGLLLGCWHLQLEVNLTPFPLQTVDTLELFVWILIRDYYTYCLC